MPETMTLEDAYGEKAATAPQQTATPSFPTIQQPETMTLDEAYGRKVEPAERPDVRQVRRTGAEPSGYATREEAEAAATRDGQTLLSEQGRFAQGGNEDRRRRYEEQEAERIGMESGKVPLPVEQVSLEDDTPEERAKYQEFRQEQITKYAEERRLAAQRRPTVEEEIAAGYPTMRMTTRDEAIKGIRRHQEWVIEHPEETAEMILGESQATTLGKINAYAKYLARYATLTVAEPLIGLTDAVLGIPRIPGQGRSVIESELQADLKRQGWDYLILKGGPEAVASYGEATHGMGFKTVRFFSEMAGGMLFFAGASNLGGFTSSGFRWAKLASNASIFGTLIFGGSLLEGKDKEAAFLDGTTAMLGYIALGAVSHYGNQAWRAIRHQKKLDDSVRMALKELGLKWGASPTEVKAAFRAKAKATHPDLGGNAEKFRAATEAYDFLMNRATTYRPPVKPPTGAGTGPKPGDIVPAAKEAITKPSVGAAAIKPPSQPAPLAESTPVDTTGTTPTPEGAETPVAPEGVKRAGEAYQAKVFHGTTPAVMAKIQKKGFKPKIINGQYFGSGVYLSPDKTEAARYGDAVGEFDVDLKKPFVLDLDKYRTVEEWYDEIQDEIDIPLKNEYGEAITVHATDPETFKAKLSVDATEASQAITGYLQEKGYDGVVVRRGGKDVEIVVFDAAAVKAPVPAKPKAPAKPAKEAAKPVVKPQKPVQEARTEPTPTETGAKEVVAPEGVERAGFPEGEYDYIDWYKANPPPVEPKRETIPPGTPNRTKLQAEVDKKYQPLREQYKTENEEWSTRARIAQKHSREGIAQQQKKSAKVEGVKKAYASELEALKWARGKIANKGQVDRAIQKIKSGSIGADYGYLPNKLFRAWYPAAKNHIAAALRKMGGIRYYKSGQTAAGSVYYELPSGARVRISDHEIPDLPPPGRGEKWIKGRSGGASHEIILDSIQSEQELNETIDWIKEKEVPAKPAKEAAKPVEKPKEAKVEPPAEIPVNETATVPTESLTLDPERFQYKLATGEKGVTGALRGVKKFEPSRAGVIAVWTDSADGKTYVVNGHQRYSLAQKSDAKSVNVIRLEADNARDARAQGALINIGEGRGNSLDAAKFMRDAGLTLEGLQEAGVPIRESLAVEGAALANLSEPLFDSVVRGDIPINIGRAIGENLDNPVQQMELHKLIRRHRGSLSADVISELVRLVKSTGEVTETTETLFGKESIAKGYVIEKAKLSAWIKSKLGKDKRLFGRVAKEAGELARANNVIDIAASKGISEDAAVVGFYYDQMTGKVGPAADALEEGARRIAEGDNTSEVRKETYEKIQEIVSRTVEGKPVEGAERRGEGVEGGRVQVEEAKPEQPARVISEEGGKTLADFIADESGQLDVEKAARALLAAQSQFLQIAEPAKLVEMRHGEDAYARIIKAMHMPEAEAARWRRQKFRAAIDYRKMTRKELMAECERREIAYKKRFKKSELIKIIQQNDIPKVAEATYEAFRDYLSHFTPKELENLMLARGNPATAEGQALARDARNALPEELQQTLGAIQQVANFNFKMLQKVAGKENVGFVEDYFYGVYKDQAKTKRFLDHYRTTKRFLHKKVFPTYADAYAYGLRLRDANPMDNLLREFSAISRLHQMVQLRDDLLAGGEGRYIVKGEDAGYEHREWATIEDPTFKGLLIEPDMARMINNLIATNKVSHSKPLSGLRAINNIARQIKFVGSAFHLGVVAKQAVADTGPLGFLKPWTWPKLAKQIILPRRGLPKIGSPEDLRYIALGGSHRYSIESQAQQALERWMTSKEYRAWWRIARLPARTTLWPARKFVQWMFNNYIPALKEAKYFDEVARAEKKLGRKLTDAECISIIKEGQNFYGEMNERLFGRSATATSALRFLFMAPGFREGNYRTMAKALMQWRKGGPTGGAWRSRINIPQSLFLTMLAATTGTIIFTGKPPKPPENEDEFRDLFKVKTPWKDDKGRDIYIDLLTYDKDYWNQLVSPLWKLVTGESQEAAEQSLETFTKTLGGMKSTTFGAAKDLMALTSGEAVTDWKGDRVYYITDPFLVKANKMAVHWWNRAQPISTSVAIRMMKRKTSPLVALIGASMGLRPAYSEHDKHVNELARDIFSLRDNQEQLYYKLGVMWHPRKAIDDYNDIVKQVKSSPYMNDELREMLKRRPLRINIERLLQNKAHTFTNPSRTKKQQKRDRAYFENFGLAEQDVLQNLKRYYARKKGTKDKTKRAKIWTFRQRWSGEAYDVPTKTYYAVGVTGKTLDTEKRAVCFAYLQAAGVGLADAKTLIENHYKAQKGDKSDETTNALDRLAKRWNAWERNK